MNTNNNKRFTKFNFNASKYGVPMDHTDECERHEEEEVVQNNVDQKRTTVVTREMVENVVNKTLANKYAQALMEIQALKHQIEVYRNTIKVLLEDK